MASDIPDGLASETLVTLECELGVHGGEGRGDDSQEHGNEGRFAARGRAQRACITVQLVLDSLKHTNETPAGSIS